MVECAMDSLHSQLLFHWLLGHDDLDSSGHSGRSWPVLQRHALAPPNDGPVDFTDDCALGDHRLGSVFLFLECRLGEDLSWHHSGSCGFGHTICDHHGDGHLVGL